MTLGPGSNAATQRDRILAVMRDRRGAGGWVHSSDFRSPTVDGGPEIHNITPRISELGKIHAIESRTRADRTREYRLRWDVGDVDVPLKQLVAEAREAARSEEIAAELQLFEPALPLPAPAPAARCALFDWEDEAA
ncbi:MAG: hypothetical protein ACTHMY_17965 [Solirubrobacteraceae bacterium]